MSTTLGLNTLAGNIGSVGGGAIDEQDAVKRNDLSRPAANAQQAKTTNASPAEASHAASQP